MSDNTSPTDQRGTAYGPTAQARYLFVGLAGLLAGFCWFFGNGLTGDYWYLVWLAPVPILTGSFCSSERTSFWLAFGAYLLGRLSWFSYLETVTGLLAAISITGLLAFVYARIVVRSRRLVFGLNAWYAVLAYPALLTAFDYLLLLFSPDGTATSLAYSQANVLPLIQMASVTGIPGITFVVSFLPSALAVGWLAHAQRRQWFPYLLGSVMLLVGVPLLAGLYRLNTTTVSKELPVGLLSLTEQRHRKTAQRTLPDKKRVAEEYAAGITQLAKRGVRIVVLPETAIRLDSADHSPIVTYLRTVARQNRIYIVAGIGNYAQANARNTALVISPSAKIETEYTKRHLVRGFERHFSPGGQVGIFSLDSLKMGVAICKDLDFPVSIRQYGKQAISVLWVPANDFSVDDWLHARMAILRGVENGFSVVRAARQGRLTISDPLGRVRYETSTSAGDRAMLLGTVQTDSNPTLYVRLGDWFGVLNVVLILVLTVLNAQRKQRNTVLADVKFTV